MRILITGGSGRLGFLLVERFLQTDDSVYYTFLTNKIQQFENGYCVDLSNKPAVSELFENINPEVVIHSAALTNVDLCETDHKLADKINVDSTVNLLNACKKSNSKIVFVSSSFVFDGKKSLYHEDDATNPINYYGHTKKLCEDMIKESGLEFIIARTDQPYGPIQEWQKSDSVKKITNKLRQKKTCTEPTDWFNNPTYSVNFIDCMLKLVENDEQGIYHLVGSSYINRFDWAVRIAAIFDNDKSLVKPVTSSEFNLPARRPNSNLSNAKATSKTGVNFDDIDKGLIKFKKFLDSNKGYMEKYFSN